MSIKTTCPYCGVGCGVIASRDAAGVVRVEGETGSHQDPNWSDGINTLGTDLDTAVAQTVGERTLSDLLDELEENRGQV